MLFASICRMAEHGGIIELTWSGHGREGELILELKKWFYREGTTTLNTKEVAMGLFSLCKKNMGRHLHTVLSPRGLPLFGK